jgi:D-xylose transport system substrate-binding protein
MAGTVPVSGQDADKAALNRIALGTQTVSVWKDSRELGKRAAEIALDLAGGKTMDKIDGVTTFEGGPKKVKMQSIFLKPEAITKDNLNVVIDAGWISKAEACQGVKAGSVKACD